MTTAIEKSRNISSDELDRYLNEGLAMGQASNAVDYKLADGLRYRYEVENCVKEMAGQDVKRQAENGRSGQNCLYQSKRKREQE